MEISELFYTFTYVLKFKDNEEIKKIDIGRRDESAF